MCGIELFDEVSPIVAGTSRGPRADIAVSLPDEIAGRPDETGVPAPEADMEPPAEAGEGYRLPGEVPPPNSGDFDGEQEGERSSANTDHPAARPFSEKAVEQARVLRLQAGLSARELAEACEQAAAKLGADHTLTRGKLAKLESGVMNNLGLDECMVLARALGVPPAALLGETWGEQEARSRAEERTRLLHEELGRITTTLAQAGKDLERALQESSPSEEM